MSVQYDPGTEGLTDPTRHLQAALEAVAETAKKLKEERDEARAVIRMLWERAETHLDLSDEEIERVDRSWGETAK